MSTDTKYAIGIDNGCGTGEIATRDDYGQPYLAPTRENEEVMPTAVFFDSNDVPIVGSEALSELYASPDRVFRFFKKKIGTDEVLFRNKAGREYRARDLYSLVLKKLASDASDRLGKPVKDIVLTVPANWGSVERSEAKEAAKAAGVNVLELLDEPVAGMIAYGYPKAKDGLLMAFDFGAGSFDCTIIDVKNRHFKVLSSEGDCNLGGVNIDEDLEAWLLEKLKARCKKTPDPSKDHRLFTELREAAIVLKHAMSQRESKKVFLSYEGQDIEVTLTRDEFNKVARPYVEKTVEFCRNALAAKGFSWSDLDATVLMGGSSRLLLVKEMLKAESGLDPKMDLDPDRIVAYGAALHASQLLSQDNQVVVSSSGKVLPAPRVQVQGVVSKNVGVAAIDSETKVERNFVMIEKGAAIPVEHEEFFGLLNTATDSASIKVVEGDRDAPVDQCGQLDEFILDGIPAGKENKERIKVCLKVEQSGIVEVHAVDTVTGKEIKGSSQYEKKGQPN